MAAQRSQVGSTASQPRRMAMAKDEEEAMVTSVT